MSLKFYLRWGPIILQSLWDIAILVEGISLLQKLEVDFALEYIINFLALNWRVLLLRWALWRSRFEGIEYVMLFGGLGWAILQAVGAVEGVGSCGETETVLNNMVSQTVYYGFGVVCGLLVILLDLWEVPTSVDVYIKDQTVWVQDPEWRSFTITGYGGAIPSGPPTFTLPKARVEALTRFLRRAKHSTKRRASKLVVRMIREKEFMRL